MPSDFNKLWAGQTVSLLGTALTVFALPTLAILVLHATALQIGILTALARLPFPILGMPVGAIVDRFSRRKIMIAADVLRFAILATVPLCAFLGTLSMPLLNAVALLTGIASVFFDISYQSYLPDIVSVEQLSHANVKLEISSSGAGMAGTALAGMLVQFAGASVAIAVDAVSYLGSVASLALIHTQEAPLTGPSLSVRQGLRDIQEGLRFVFLSHDLRFIVCGSASVSFASAMLFSVGLIYSYRILALQPAVLSLVFAFSEISFVGALLAPRVRKWLGLRATLIAMVLGCGTSVACMLLAQVVLPYVVIFVAGAVLTICVTIYNVNQVTYRQAIVEPGMQGRVNATMRTFMWGTSPLGALFGGTFGTLFGVPATIALSAALVSTGALCLIPLRERKPLARR